MKCKNCNEKEAIKYSKYSTGEFCCRECARSYSTKENRKEISKKVSEKLKKRKTPEYALKNLEKGRVGHPISEDTKKKISISLLKRNSEHPNNLGKAFKKCEICGKYFCSGNKGTKKETNRKYCSIECSKLSKGLLETRENQSKIMSEKAQNGLIKNGSHNCIYYFKNKKIKCDSKVEYTCLDFFEKNHSVIDIKRSGIIIKYEYKGIIKRFNPDFIIITINDVFIVECKTIIKNKFLNDKWRKYNEVSKIKKEKLEIYAKKNNMKSFWFTKELHRKFYDSLKNRKDILI